jgi:hypothetical protein
MKQLNIRSHNVGQMILLQMTLNKKRAFHAKIRTKIPSNKQSQKIQLLSVIACILVGITGITYWQVS